MDVLLILVFQVVDTIVAVLPEVPEGGAFFDLIMAVIPVVVAYLTLQIMKGLKSVIGIVDGLPTLVQRLLVLVIAAGLTFTASALGIELPSELAQIGDTDVSNMLLALSSMGLAMVFHAGDKAK